MKPTQNKILRGWVDEMAQLTKPDRIHWCDGSEEEYSALCNEIIASGKGFPLNTETHPNSLLHRSDPTDVARVEHLTFICTRQREDVGPNNNWMEPNEGHQMVDGLFEGSMQGRTMYVIPYVMGPLASPYARTGVEVTDSPYVAANMRIMTRMGSEALARLEAEPKVPFVKGLHCTGDLNPERRYILHFPETLTIKSIGSGYGGNALLGKKCHALRLASWQARQEGWLAEHMLIMGVETPEGETHYIAAAFPSACGKTNLAMIIPPLSQEGYKITTVGDDIAWLHVGDDGRLYAINPEAGMFGVAPGTSEDTNPHALTAVQKNSIYTNVAVTPDMQPWWEGLTKDMPENLTDWQGRPYDPENGKAAQANSRFTAPVSQLPCLSPEFDNPQGVPISAILFGGRRASLAPLVLETLDWTHGVFAGATVASETTAASIGKVGVVRRDPMAMRPFCGYHFGDYFAHWLGFQEKSDNLPKIFHVNWFRQNTDGDFIWPGFGDNVRVLRWVLDRCQGKGEAVRTPIGYLPTPGSIDIEGLDLEKGAMDELISFDRDLWQTEMDDIKMFLAEYRDRLPPELRAEAERIKRELQIA